MQPTNPSPQVITSSQWQPVNHLDSELKKALLISQAVSGYKKIREKSS